MKDRIKDLGNKIVNSDLWNIGLHGIFVKEVDKINMSETSARITKKIILGLETLAIGVAGYACAKGYITPEVHAINTDSSETTPSPVEQFNQEKLVNYGQFLIGEAKIGKISDLTLQTNPNEETVSKVKDLAYQIIPESKDKDLSVNIYDIIGDKGTAPFITVSINDDNGNLEFAYVGFSIDENNVQRPPQNGDIQIFYPLRVVRQDDNSNFIGIPDITTKNLQVPVMFFIDTQGNSYFYPPYTDYVAQSDNPFGGMKVQAIMAPVEVEVQLPEGSISELQKTLGENYKLTKAKEGDYFVIDGVDNLKFNADGTAELVFEDRDLKVDFRTISVKDEALRIQGFQNKEGEWTRITSGAPTTKDAEGDPELTNYIANLPKQVYLLGAANEKEIDRTNRLVDQIVMEKTADYDPVDEFKGIIVDGKEVELVDLTSEWWDFWGINSNSDNQSKIAFVGSGTSSYASKQIALDQGWSTLEVVGTDGKVLNQFIKMPVMDVNSGSPFIMSALINKEKLPEILELLTKEKRGRIDGGIMRSNQPSDPAHPEDMLTNEELTTFLTAYNKAFLELNLIKSEMTELPLELKTMVYLGFELRPE
ncbi:MAG: hypothetical protein ACD_19C00176G0035 [uncultured bacterium]|nr:MAG: hypothetical protein ACD_19C00176G0035 [uncultured bacterium]